ncbi:hypothetical protein ACFSL6_20360 [Paenibacillus thailandensis]|uniref:YfhD family protein n=1 Tax=Paenibacillus thailandensis TaxID=393250 RepID=A0ABW5R0I1_9BACL
MKGKKIVPFNPKPVPLKDKSQKELIDERRALRESRLSKFRKKEK